jgi:hypothetical protein
MRIEGLTQAQCDMLDAMWALDTAEELYNYFQTLSNEEYQIAITLQEILIQECEEDEVKNTNMAKQMLQSIGVKLA